MYTKHWNSHTKLHDTTTKFYLCDSTFLMSLGEQSTVIAKRMVQSNFLSQYELLKLKPAVLSD